MYGQLIDMQGKLRHAESQLKRRQAKLKTAEAKQAGAQYVIDAHKANSGSGLLHEILQAEADLLDAEAERLEIEADIPTWEMNKTAAEQELKDIEDLMLELKPQCKYAHLPILEMSEASQEDEWLGELKLRAENFLITAGTIPHDHFQTMRMHPRFKTELVPHIQIMNDKVVAMNMVGHDRKPLKTLSQVMLETEAPLLLTNNKEA